METFKFNVGQMVEVISEDCHHYGRVGRVRQRNFYLGIVNLYWVVDTKSGFRVREEHLGRCVEPFRKES